MKSLWTKCTPRRSSSRSATSFLRSTLKTRNSCKVEDLRSWGSSVEHFASVLRPRTSSHYSSCTGYFCVFFWGYDFLDTSSYKCFLSSSLVTFDSPHITGWSLCFFVILHLDCLILRTELGCRLISSSCRCPRRYSISGGFYDVLMFFSRLQVSSRPTSMNGSFTLEVWAWRDLSIMINSPGLGIGSRSVWIEPACHYHNLHARIPSICASAASRSKRGSISVCRSHVASFSNSEVRQAYSGTWFHNFKLIFK